LPAKIARTDEINQKMSEPGFWDNQEVAQALVAELSQLTLTVKPLK
jgi:hypothetical protein